MFKRLRTVFALRAYALSVYFGRLAMRADYDAVMKQFWKQNANAFRNHTR